ncbi:MAG: hypothetical protein LBR39_06175 [Coriobacteriales bacterium]|jgi:shikimate dehydrogenase|nr:hypothetical protein [Coriobacteriales bacterium]
MTLQAGLLGYPIEHSLSPALHNAAYAELGLDWEYRLYPCENVDAFQAHLARARQNPLDYLGFNVTTPWKLEAYRACTLRSPEVEICHSANVLGFGQADSADRSSLRAATTDGAGVWNFLRDSAGLQLAGASIVLCGTGPAAASILLTLLQNQAGSVTVLSRDAQQAQVEVSALVRRYGETRYRKSMQKLSGQPISQLHAAVGAAVQDYQQLPPIPPVQVAGYDQAGEHLAQAVVLIDATPLGMSAGDAPVVPAELLHSGLAVLDLVYGHGETTLLAAARAAGAQAFDGLGMLVEQAALTIEFWARAKGHSGLVAPRELMYKTAGGR